MSKCPLCGHEKNPKPRVHIKEVVSIGGTDTYQGTGCNRAIGRLKTTSDPNKVTCLNCLRNMVWQDPMRWMIKAPGDSPKETT